MASATMTQGAQGAAGGAMSGAMLGATYGSIAPGIGTAIGAVVGLALGVMSGSAADADFKNQQAWAEYNSKMQYSTNLANMTTSFGITAINIMASRRAADLQSNAARQAAQYNAAMIGNTVAYNTSLINQDLARVWEEEELDLHQLELYKKREQGTIISEQSASGTVLGTGSNADVVIDQETQRALDATIISHGADIQAANLKNQRAQGIWQGDVAIKQTLWEGEMAAHNATVSSDIQNQSAAMGALLQGRADLISARQGRSVGQYAQTINAANFTNQNTQAMVSGMFSTAGSYVTNSYANKQPGDSIAAPAGSSPRATGGGYNFQNSLTRSSGTSLLAGP